MAKMDRRELEHLKRGIHMLRWRVYRLTQRMEMKMSVGTRLTADKRKWNLSELDGEWQ
jgi:hypothetical protein